MYISISLATSFEMTRAQLAATRLEALLWASLVRTHLDANGCWLSAPDGKSHHLELGFVWSQPNLGACSRASQTTGPY